MPAPADSPMHKDLWSRVEQIAQEDFDREESKEGGPSRLDIYLLGGSVIFDCHLVDSLNSLDDQSIDVVRDEDGLNAVWIVPLSAIAAIHQRYPKPEDK